MPEYRAYILDRDGHIKNFEPLVCGDDAAAIATAKRMVDGHDVEVWQGARRVTTLAHKGDPTKLVPKSADELRLEAAKLRQQASETDALTKNVLLELADRYETDARQSASLPESGTG